MTDAPGPGCARVIEAARARAGLPALCGEAVETRDDTAAALMALVDRPIGRQLDEGECRENGDDDHQSIMRADRFPVGIRQYGGVLRLIETAAPANQRVEFLKEPSPS